VIAIGNAEQEIDLGTRLDEVIDRIFGQHVEEGIQRLAQRRVQAAAVDQRALYGAILEALRHGEAVLGNLDDIEQADLLRGAPEADATIAAAERSSIGKP